MDERLRSLIAEILDLQSSDVVPDMSRADTEQWDSLAHLRLVTAFEEAFGLQLTMDQIAAIQSPRQMQQFIEHGGTGNG